MDHLVASSDATSPRRIHSIRRPPTPYPSISKLRIVTSTPQITSSSSFSSSSSPSETPSLINDSSSSSSFVNDDTISIRSTSSTTTESSTLSYSSSLDDLLPHLHPQFGLISVRRRRRTGFSFVVQDQDRDRDWDEEDEDCSDRIGMKNGFRRKGGVEEEDKGWPFFHHSNGSNYSTCSSTSSSSVDLRP